MIEILRTNDLVLISVIESLLKAEGVAYFVADQHMAAVEGSLGFLPRRIMVDSARGGPGAPAPRRGGAGKRTARWLSRRRSLRTRRLPTD